MQTPNPTLPQVPAAICGVFIGANVVADDAKDAIGRIVRVDKERALVSYIDRPAVTMPVQWLRLFLGSPLAMCHAARWLATRLGMDPGATAPLWRLTAEGWLLETPDSVWMFGPPEKSCLTEYTAVPGIILEQGQDAAALAAACVAVGGAA